MAFRWLRAYFDRRDSREGVHYRDTPTYQKRGRQIIWPEEYTQRRTFTEDSYGSIYQRPDDKVWQGETEEHVRPRWITGWLGLGRGQPTEPPPRRDEPYEPWPGAGERHGWVQDERPYRAWPGEEDDQRGGR